MSKQFGYLATIVSRIVSTAGVIDETGEPVIVTSPDGAKGIKTTGTLSAAMNGTSIQAKLRIGNTVETARDACVKLASAALLFVERKGFKAAEGESSVKRLNPGGRPTNPLREAGATIVARVFAENPDHETLFAASVKALVNEANTRAALWRRVYVYDPKTGNVLEPSFTVSTNQYGSAVPGSPVSEEDGNRRLTERYKKFGLAVRSVTADEIKILNSRKGKKGPKAVPDLPAAVNQ
jgi:hypothetical protein